MCVCVCVCVYVCWIISTYETYAHINICVCVCVFICIFCVLQINTQVFPIMQYIQNGPDCLSLHQPSNTSKQSPNYHYQEQCCDVLMQASQFRDQLYILRKGTSCQIGIRTTIFSADSSFHLDTMSVFVFGSTGIIADPVHRVGTEMSESIAALVRTRRTQLFQIMRIIMSFCVSIINTKNFTQIHTKIYLKFSLKNIQ